MNTALHGWMNRPIRVTLRLDATAIVEGTLFHIDDAGIMLEKSTGKIFLPFAAILHIKLSEDPQE
ncbi:hypothetical protein D3C84_1211210 [compost metagenome]